MPITFTSAKNGIIYGTTLAPETGDVPLVSDVSSCFLSEPIDVSEVWSGVRRCSEEHRSCWRGYRYHSRRSYQDEWLPNTPTILRYKTQADADSMSNTSVLWHLHLRKGLQVVEVPWRA